MLKQKEIGLSHIAYGDICKRSSLALSKNIDFEDFEEELLAAISEESKEKKDENQGKN